MLKNINISLISIFCAIGASFCFSLSDFTVKQNEPTKITLLGCHTFCTKCIMPWLQECNDTCPVCRKKIEKVE